MIWFCKADYFIEFHLILFHLVPCIYYLMILYTVLFNLLDIITILRMYLLSFLCNSQVISKNWRTCNRKVLLSLTITTPDKDHELPDTTDDDKLSTPCVSRVSIYFFITNIDIRRFLLNPCSSNIISFSFWFLTKC